MPDDLVDHVVIDHNLPIEVQSQVQSSSGTFVTMNMNIAALCAQYFEGSDCTQHCIPGANSVDVNIDHCVGVNCNMGMMYVWMVLSCNCNPGFTGELCQTNTDDCVGVNCSGNRVCVDGVNNFTCECMTGYSGLL